MVAVYEWITLFTTYIMVAVYEKVNYYNKVLRNDSSINNDNLIDAELLSNLISNMKKAKLVI